MDSSKPGQKCGLEVGDTKLGGGSGYNRKQGEGTMREQNKKCIENPTTTLKGDVFWSGCGLHKKWVLEKDI